MRYSIYLRLIVLTAGTLLPFFWIVVILGHRRQRNFERIFFFLCLALVFFFGASLLNLNAQVYYTVIPASLEIFCWAVVCVGLWFLPSLLVHLQVEYAQIRELLAAGVQKQLWLVLAYLPAILLARKLYSTLQLRSGFDFVLPSDMLGWQFQLWLVAAVLISVGWQCRFLGGAPDRQQRSFHKALCIYLSAMALSISSIHFAPRIWSAWGLSSGVGIGLVACFILAPLVALIRNVQQFNFLQIGRQRNLIYAVFATFLALLYLSLVRRASLWLEPYLPPEASAALLLFLPVVFFEPLQRVLGRRLKETAQKELDRVQPLMATIQQEARHGNLELLTRFIENGVKQTFELSSVKFGLREPVQITGAQRLWARDKGGMGEITLGEPRCQLVILKEGQRAYGALGNVIATLLVQPHGAAISGETRAALEFLCEQLPGALDLCRLIAEKLQLERELAERERLALVGQMAASISHNLKNPLGSIKTILQVQMESPELPESIRGETKMVLEEIGRLSSKLNQLLQFSRPAVRAGGGGAVSCDARAVLDEVTGVLRHEAERRGVLLETKLADGSMLVAAGAEAVSDIASNLLVNALEASQWGGHVLVSAAANDGVGVLVVEDDGPGIPASAREKVLQPFFTTKAQGTGLGLAIVARRVAESGGKMDWESPVREGRGTRFTVTFVAAVERGF